MSRVILLAALAALPAGGDEWPLFRNTPTGTGVAASAIPDKIDLLWQFSTKDSIESAPAVADRVVYVGSMDEHLYALDLATGKEKWKYKATDAIKAPPSVHAGAVYVGDG